MGHFTSEVLERRKRKTRPSSGFHHRVGRFLADVIASQPLSDMVRLFDALLQQKQPREVPWYQTKVWKVNASWGVLLVLGLGAFALAKDDAIKKRQQQMRIRKEIAKQVEIEQLEETQALEKKN